MANVYVQNIGVPRKARNGRIYTGVSFNTTNPYQQSETAPQRHWEIGRLTDLQAYSVIHLFANPFAVNIPIGYNNLKVYRMVEIQSGKWINQNVLYYHPTEVSGALQYGFQLNIDASEPLEGVIIEFMFTE